MKDTTEKYRVEIPDIDYYRRLIACQDACPVHTSAQSYVNAISQGNYQEGYLSARQPNPLASTCGRVCNAPCETACRRGKFDAPVAIRTLKRFLCERHGVETKSQLRWHRPAWEKVGVSLLSSPPPPNSVTAGSFGVAQKVSRGAGRKKARVAIVGAGPAGLAAAQDLAILGHRVTIFEASPIPGGMLRLGLPEFRLPRKLVGHEIAEILDQGVELRLNTRLGRDFTLSSLKAEGYEAIFIAVGAYIDRELAIEGAKLDGVIFSLDFLRKANLGEDIKVGRKVLVIGGGGTAIDAARSSLRIGEGMVEKDGIAALDAARGAMRLGAMEVHILYRGTRLEMRAPDEEVEDAIAEGAILHTSRAPKRFIGRDGKVKGLETVRMESMLNEAGRRVLRAISGSEEVYEGDSVIVATGQGSDLSFIQPEDGVQVTGQQTIAVDPDTLATTAPGVFAGGDAAFGPRIIIEAVRDGHTAARSIDQYLQGKTAKVVARGWMERIPLGDLPTQARLDVPRQRPPTLPLDRRIGIAEVEQNYAEQTAVEQADRCLRCHIQTVFNGDLCILCGGCVDVCPQNCYKMVRLDRIAGDAELEALVKARYGRELHEFSAGVEDRDLATAMIKDEDRCVRCGLCAQRCPVGAITMEAFSFEEELVYA